MVTRTGNGSRSIWDSSVNVTSVTAQKERGACGVRDLYAVVPGRCDVLRSKTFVSELLLHGSLEYPFSKKI